MKKIMFVIGGLAGGGAERVVATIASALAEKDYQVSILTYYKEDNEYPFSSKINRINISNGNREKFNEMSIIERLMKIRKCIKNVFPDEIICFLPHCYVYIFISTLFTKYNKILSYAVRSNPNKEKKKIEKLQKVLLIFSKRIIVQNKGQATCFSSIFENKVVIIPNPMYDELFKIEKNYSEKAENIVSVGRLTLQKNYTLAINSIHKIKNAFPNIKYYIYGNGSEEYNLRELIKSKNLENNVFLMGYEKDRNIIFGDKDIYLMTSKYEGMPIALAEAMCIGIPSISTDCDFGPRDLIINDDMGILLKDFEVDTLVYELTKVIDNYSLYIEKAKCSKKILKKRYSFDKIIQQWENIFSV